MKKTQQSALLARKQSKCPSSEKKAKVKAKKPRPEKADCERDEMSDSDPGPTLCPTPPPPSKVKAKKPRPEKADCERDETSDSESGPTLCPTPPPPSKVKEPTAKKPDRCSAQLTEAQQDIMFEWLEQTPAIYDTIHVDYERRIQLFGEQAVRMGDGLDGTT